MTIVAAIAMTVRNFVNAASISCLTSLVLGGERPMGPQQAHHGFQTAR